MTWVVIIKTRDPPNTGLDSLESRGKQTLHQKKILRYNFGFNLDSLCG